VIRFGFAITVDKDIFQTSISSYFRAAILHQHIKGPNKTNNNLFMEGVSCFSLNFGNVWQTF
jgi:hypothetical protein